MVDNETISNGVDALSRYFGPAVLKEAALAVAIFLASYLLIRLLLLAFSIAVRGLGARARMNFDAFLLDAVQGPLKLFALVFSAYLALALTVPQAGLFGRSMGDLLFIAIVFIAAYLLARALNSVIRWYGKEMAHEGRGKEVFPMVRKIIGFAFYLSAFAIVLDHLGVQIMPLVAGLGIAGLAVALALQDTLANFFAGVYILADKPVRIGDYVRLEDGSEGYVDEVGWRSTKIRLLTENSLIIPNSLLAQQKIVNHYTPNGLITSVAVSAAYDSDPEKVERVLLAAADEVVEKAHGTVKSFKPVVRLSSLGEMGLGYTVVFQVEQFTDQGAVAHAMRKGIVKAFRKEKIEIPFTAKTLHTGKA